MGTPERHGFESRPKVANLGTLDKLMSGFF